MFGFVFGLAFNAHALDGEIGSSSKGEAEISLTIPARVEATPGATPTANFNATVTVKKRAVKKKSGDEVEHLLYMSVPVISYLIAGALDD